VKDLKARGVGLKVLTGQGAAIDTTKAEGRMFFGMFAVLAEFERELIRERTTAGMKAAKRRGVHVGRPLKVTPEKLATAARELDAGNSQRVVANTLGVAVSTLREAMKGRAA
jgi:DNA invertase Pin-like site-specific DNA recombinase